MEVVLINRLVFNNNTVVILNTEDRWKGKGEVNNAEK